ncbi:MAG: 16S rRNA (cytosine(1402)-N(4))-methyltransferase [uncultured Acidimicrobiales bacterium]|uniref:Ribosomal RNA small subunit methyltransferase H n=1 Tax=uncultured Acidimicrobiales bacterium TaxID=310071 RepID=A0A6J4J7X1_9ACTN|nr:MAG: 16S rRNA (cytosine(1402)-N(4))-methyltransferase [uncultured Acidimicrobiales bacterium]
MGGTEASSAVPHLPVMVAEVVDALRPVPPGPIVDATLGAGGHAAALLDALPDHTLIGLDRDDEALALAGDTLDRFGDRVVLRRANFDDLGDVVAGLGRAGGVSGVLFDLGVSSMQLDDPERGFSYRGEGPLDMRADRRQPTTAADIVNGYDEVSLARVLARHGEERFARRIARAIVAARPLATTGQLADVVREAIPAPARRRGGHPAKRTFQAIRIEVNGELATLGATLDRALDLLVPGGRCVVLAYHSGEDRIVKDRFGEAVTGGCVCPPQLPCVCGAVPRARLVWRGAHRPGPAELAANPRSESARLRAAEKLEVSS